MLKFLYNIVVSFAYLLGLFLFVISGILQQAWTIFFLVLGLFFFCFYQYKKKKNV
uniref:Uncharacterized protein n=1 Tax=Dictyota dichotoma TaxID=2876 RepID=Q2TUA2_DICDH|nr:hypothetical protein [Dictyota dichotoma]AAV63572.1 hypothetical protein [Dictyota dichotoma]